MEKTENHKYWVYDKTPELALFYNLAYDNITAQIAKDEGKKPKEIEESIKSFSEAAPQNDLCEATYIKLKHYLWKGYDDDRNSNGSAVDIKDKKIIRLLLKKLEQVRNFQSHYYHANDMLRFEDVLRKFLNEKYEYAIRSLEKDFSPELKEYNQRMQGRLDRSPGREVLFNQDLNGTDHWLNSEGKNFLLGFFLTRGQMKRFLKQRKGCKRDDTKDFRIKHQIYTYYCHRDAADRFFYNQDDNFLAENESLTPQILEKRQLYKINTYLNDVSAVISNPEIFPILIHGKKAETVKELILFCRDRKLFESLEFETEEGDQPAKSIIIKHKEFEVDIRVSQRTFHKLILDAIREGEERIIKHLRYFSIERMQIMRLIKNEKLLEALRKKRAEDIKLWLDEYDTFRLRNKHSGLRKKFSNWIDLYLGGSKDEKAYRKGGRVLGKEVIGIKEKLDSIPVELRYLDLYYLEERKPRQYKDPNLQHGQFMRFAIQYFIDKQILPQIHWQWQAFLVRKDKDGKQVLKEHTCFSPKKPPKLKESPSDSDWRLKFTYDDQMLFSFEATNVQAAGEKKERKDPLQAYLMGHQAIKNLLVAKFIYKKDINTFFNVIKEDVERLYKGETTGFELLEPKTIPATFSKEKGELKKKTLNRVDFLIKTLMIAKDTHGELSRDSKNRLIMRCYRLFDWKKRSSGVEAFLRKNEYKNLSIYHYTMEKEKIPFILDEIGKTNIIPEKVKGLLKKSPNLDMLLENTIDETVVLLEKFKKDVGKATLNHQFLPIARKLGVPVYRTSIEKNGHVPYTVHPDLVLKSALNAEITDAKFRTITRNKMRTLSQALYEGNYKAEEYFTFFGGTESFKKDLKQVFFNVISAVNDNAEYDSLLFSIGQEYDPQYSKVETMHDEKLKLLTKDMANVKKGFEGTETVSANVEVKYRQLGDILTSMNERKIENIVRYIFRKYTDEKLGEKGIKPVRAGMKVYTVPFIEIKQEKERIEQLSLNLIGAILEFEKGVIEKAPSLQKISETAEQLAKEKGGLARLDFEAVLKKGGKVEVHKGVPLTEVRNSALHAGVPQEKPEDKARGKGAIPFWKYEDMEDHPLLENYIYERKQYRKAIKSYYSGGK